MSRIVLLCLPASLVSLGLFAISCTAPAPGSNADAGEPDATERADADVADAPLADALADGPATCDPSDCPLGCHNAEPRCNDVAPSNGLGAYLDIAAQGIDLVIPDDSTIDTTDGTIIDSAGNPILVASDLVPAPENGVAIRVFAVKSLTIGDVNVPSDGDGDDETTRPALAFVSDGDIVIEGVVVVDAGTLTDGGCAGGVGTSRAGHGGSGFGSAGGAGGDGHDSAGDVKAGGERGSTTGNAELVPLRGGCDGTSGYTSAFQAPAGGAIQLVSRTEIRFADGAFLDLNGAGGVDTDIVAGEVTSEYRGGGASGGGALLEAPVVTIVAGSGITANGGGGAAECENGADGQRSLDPAAGGQCSGGSDGGNGAAGDSQATDGEESADSVLSGGGGGGLGRVRINTVGQVSSDPGAILSPTPSVGAIATR